MSGDSWQIATEKCCDPWRNVTARSTEDHDKPWYQDLAKSTVPTSTEAPTEPKAPCETKDLAILQNDLASPDKDYQWHWARDTNKCHEDQRPPDSLPRQHPTLQWSELASIRYKRHVMYRIKPCCNNCFEDFILTRPLSTLSSSST